MRLRFIQTILVIISAGLTMLFCIWVVNRWFFDLFYYQKSVTYGYWIDEELGYEDFGTRGEDLAQLVNDYSSYKAGDGVVLGLSSDDDVFNVAVISDSFGWGAGLKNGDRYAEVLEEKLNKVRPSRVYSFAMSGDSISDYVIKYKMLKQMGYPIDLYIFAFFENDILMNKNSLDNEMYDGMRSACDEPYIYSIDDHSDYYERLKTAYSPTYANRCLLTYLVRQLPGKDEAIYFEYGSAFNGEKGSNFYQIFVPELELLGLKVITADTELQKYPDDMLHVSDKEFHPSVVANQIFAKVLFEEIERRWSDQ